MAKETRPVVDRFYDKVAFIPFHTCWEWIGCKSKKGYGALTIGSRTDASRYIAKAHRLSYEIHVGQIGNGLVIDHICRNRSCVNPSHLRVVTPTINSLENSLGASALNKVKTHCKHGHEFTDENTNVCKVGKTKDRLMRTCRTCSIARSKKFREI